MDGRLGDNFEAIAAKRLSAVEAISEGRSNQHELNGIRPITEMLGKDRKTFACQYVFFDDSPDEYNYIDEHLTITLYDARENQPKRSAEYRLVYPAQSEVMRSSKRGDYCFIARKTDGGLLVAVDPATSHAAVSLDRLFGTNIRFRDLESPANKSFDLFNLEGANDDDLDLDDADLLLALGITPKSDNTDRLPEMIKKFGGKTMPTVKEFTEYTRSVCSTTSPFDDPDLVLYDWFVTTNDLYFLYERHILQPILDADLANREHIDVDTFFKLANSLKNTRSSRAGSSFEEHIAALFDQIALDYDKQRAIDGSKPDFVLPSHAAYANETYPIQWLTILGAKTTTKERWRQIKTEGLRVPTKHLITMDRQLNAGVLNEMRGHQIRPVIPIPIQAGYSPDIRIEMTAVSDFIEEARAKKARADEFMA